MELISNILSFALSSYGLMNFHKDLRKLNQEIEDIKDSKIFTPSMLKENFMSLLPKNNSENNNQEGVLKGFIEGIIQSHDYLTSSVNKNEKLVYKLNFINKIYENDQFMNRLDLIKQIPSKRMIENIPFQLKDYENNDFCNISNNKNVNPMQAIEIIGVGSILSQKASIFKRILSIFYVFFQILSLFFEDKLSYKGLQIGQNEVEFGIKVNSSIVVYGEIIFNFLTKSLRVEKPQYFLKDKSYILEEISKKVRRKIFLIILYHIVNFYSGYKLFKRIFVYLSKKFKKTAIEEAHSNLKKLEKFRNCEKMSCVICYIEVRNIILKPCKHLAICSICLKNIINSKVCPICKDPFNSFTEIFAK